MPSSKSQHGIAWIRIWLEENIPVMNALKENFYDAGSWCNSWQNFPWASVSPGQALCVLCEWCHEPTLAQLMPADRASPRAEPTDSTATTLTGILPSSSQPRYQLCSHKKSFQQRICFPSRFPEETRGPRGSQKWRMLLEPHCQGAGRRTRSLTARRSHISCTYLGKLIGIGSCSFV